MLLLWRHPLHWSLAARVRVGVLDFMGLRTIPGRHGQEPLTPSELKNFDVIDQLGERARNITARSLPHLRENEN
jgi:hypothetical protein